jgi:hypothetical protein
MLAGKAAAKAGAVTPRGSMQRLVSRGWLHWLLWEGL